MGKQVVIALCIALACGALAGCAATDEAGGNNGLANAAESGNAQIDMA